MINLKSEEKQASFVVNLSIQKEKKSIKNFVFFIFRRIILFSDFNKEQIKKKES